MILGLGFLNPWALWLLPLAAVPIIIHLLNRRRYDQVRWAAMTFLLAAMKRNRRRIRMEHWLLLALRTLAVLLLVLLVAHPSFEDGLFGSMRRHHVLVLDDSGSMSHRGPASTAFEEALESMERYAQTIAGARDGDLVTVLSGTTPEQAILPVTRVGPDLPTRIREITARASTSDRAFAIRPALDAARKAFEAGEDAERAEYRIFTDLRKTDWLDDDGEASQTMIAWIRERDPETEHVTVQGVGSTDSANLAVTALHSRERVCTVGLPLTFAVDVTNHGLDATTAIDLSVLVDDRNRTTFPIPPLGAGETTTVEFSHTFHSAGTRGITASLPDDRFALDDANALAVEVREASRVLLVDGDPGDSLESSETYFLHAALEIRTEQIDSGIEVRLIAEHELGAGDLAGDALAEFDMVFLCNVGRPSEPAVKALESFVRSGGGLVVFAGNQIDARHYDTTLFRQGRGSLPARLVDVAGDIDDRQPIHLAIKDASLFEGNVDVELVEFMCQQLVSIGRYFTVDTASLPADAQVILRVGDDEGPPLLISRDVGLGRVFLVTTTADADWTSWPIYAVYQMTAISMHREAARPQDFSSRNLAASDIASIPFDPGRVRPDLIIRPSGDATGEVRTFSATAATETTASSTIEVPMAELTGFGLFELEQRRHDGSVQSDLLVRRPPLDEGKLDRVSPALLVRAIPEDTRGVFTIRDNARDAKGGAGSATGSAATNASGAAWRLSGFALLFGMLIETLLAWRFGRR